MSRSYFCPNCGAALEEGVKFCANCGASTSSQPQAPPPQQQYQPQPVQQSGPYAPAQPMPQQVVHVHTGPPVPAPGTPSHYNRTTALLLLLFLGWIGAHQFYVGKAGMGVAYIFLWFLMVTPILMFIDFIMILTGSFKDDRGLQVLNW